MKKFNLLPCPFCGHDFVVNFYPAFSLTCNDIKYPGHDTYEISCSNSFCVLYDWHYSFDDRDLIFSDVERFLNCRSDAGSDLRQ